jgi:hypothetical protein
LSSEDIQAQQEAWGSTKEGKKGANAFFSVQQKLNFNIRSVEHDTNVSTSHSLALGPASAHPLFRKADLVRENTKCKLIHDLV